MTNDQWIRRKWHPFWRNLFRTGAFHSVERVTPLPHDRATAFRSPTSDRTDHPELPLALQGAAGRIGLPSSYGGYPREFEPGTPYQVGDSTKGARIVTLYNAQYGHSRPIELPMPVDFSGQFHVEGNPTPNWAMSLANANPAGAFYDCHILIFDRATGRYHEAIGYNVHTNTVSGYGCFDPDGGWVDGAPVIAAGEPLGPLMWDPDSDWRGKPHSLTLSVFGSDKAEPTWPWLGRWVTLSQAALERIPTFPAGSTEADFVRHLRQPILIGDHGGGNGFRYRSNSAALRTADWQGWELHMRDLEPCDGKVGP